MSLGNVGSNPYSQIQSALESARQRTAPVKAETVEAKAEVRKPQSAGGGSLFEKLYGAKTTDSPSKPIRVGEKLDIYA